MLSVRVAAVLARSLPRQAALVAAWLKKSFGDQPVPPYEADARTIDILYELAECNESRDGDTALLIEDMTQKAAEYESDVVRYSNGVMSFIPAINDLTSDLYAAESKNKDMELELSNLRKKLTSALVLEKRLQDDLMKTEELLVVEKAKAESRTQNMKFLKDKSEDIKFRIKAAEEQLSASGLDTSLTHESLVNLSEKLAEIKKEAAPLKKKLESYLDLTPVMIRFSLLVLSFGWE
ncbi:hypothetical protein JD844_008195 [Phrynosoma platyrhinos]|uniref:HAUS augmin-like complex subunit 1 n=1 Tax=Phrynosoma platyrhinos TaxID=52577 RepID=A0ABQ7TED3_PHRPL|nr:hypothetical protein JD844_008195 [Phrynosoma platyrhinos]